MMVYRHKINDDENSRIAAYESLLDLFTLFSFILIFAAFIYVTQFSQNSKDGASIFAQDAVSGSGIQKTFPKDMLLLIVYQENTKDWLRVIDGVKNESVTFTVTTSSIKDVLNSLSSRFALASKINIGIYEIDQPVNPGIVIEVQRWLSDHGHHEYKIYFVGKS